MIWGDRLLDGETTGIGIWQASMNETHRTIDLIPKDVLIFDWHYENAEMTPAYFAIKGFNVVSCPWNRPDISQKQIDDMIRLRRDGSYAITTRCLGIIQTIWCAVPDFLLSYYSPSAYTIINDIKKEKKKKTSLKNQQVTLA